MLNKGEENPSQRVEADDLNIIPIVESNLTSIRGSDEQKSESAFAQREYKDEDPVPFDEEMGDDLDGSISDHIRSMCELESSTRIAAHCLQWAENKIKEEHRMFHENVQAHMAKKDNLQPSN